MVSSFLSLDRATKEHDLVSLHLRRDHCLPVILATKTTGEGDEGYAEGVVTNTRFGSFPHSTIIGVPWGSQVRASQVDTGSRGRPDSAKSKKRKAEELENGDSSAPVKDAVAAASGFVHVLPTTPENWTTGLPHRTQVVYTPDYSYILHRIRARPGSRLIESGTGSGSFTHAAARAVFNGYPPSPSPLQDPPEAHAQHPHPLGRVFSYEYHAERFQKVQAEMALHGLDDLVHVTHRDVYSEGFLVGGVSPAANAIFLDLPAPWEALAHLTRESSDQQPSAIDPDATVHICTFSPCVEQAQRTISELRRHGWLSIEMVEMQHKRIDVRREYTGLRFDGMRGANLFPTDVDEAVARLREVEKRLQDFHAGKNAHPQPAKDTHAPAPGRPTAEMLPFNGGKLVHRTESELKTHTSYLVFAVLPKAWTDQDEAAAQEKWSKHVKVSATVPKSQRQLRREAKQKAKSSNPVNQRGPDGAAENLVGNGDTVPS